MPKTITGNGAVSASDYDIAVIGGGIQGAGCAQAAAAAGHSVCILEKDSWGSATSSHSSKLIHGGLRYLETWQFGLVRESLRERRILLEIAAALVHPLPFFIPVYNESRHPPWMVLAGLSLYSLLGGFDPLSRFRCVPEREWPQLDGLKTTGLKKVYQYWDTQTDDHLLTLAVVRSAEKLGARIEDHSMFIGARDEGDRYLVSYVRQGEEKELTCRALINAGGPWAARLQTLIEGAPVAPPIELVQGSHIELAGRISRSIYYLESPVDRRAMFIMPWHGNTLVGTTEKAFADDPAASRASTGEIDYLLAAVNHYFPSFKCLIKDSFAGLRVLPGGKAGFSARPRETMVRFDNRRRPRLVSLYGGKLTTYRATAAAVIDRLGGTLGKPKERLDTSKIILELPRSARATTRLDTATGEPGMKSKLLAIGHRGAMGHEPENTLASFRKALELGADCVELDVYYVDGHLVVFHDERLERTTNGQGLLMEQDFALLRNLDAGNGESIPTLPEVFAALGGGAGLNIELKGPDTAGPVVEFISGQRRAGRPNELFLVSSFNRALLTEVRRLDPQIMIGVLVEGPLGDHLAFASEVGAYSLHTPLATVDRFLVDDAHKLGLRVFVYTVNLESDIEIMAALGVDGIFSNYPGLVPGRTDKRGTDPGWP